MVTTGEFDSRGDENRRGFEGKKEGEKECAHSLGDEPLNLHCTCFLNSIFSTETSPFFSV